MNAREELLECIENENVLCWHIWAKRDHYDFKARELVVDLDVDSILKVGYTPEEMEAELNKLDFEYDDGYGCPTLFGVVLLEGGAWLERGEYDGSEWWERKSTPKLEECY